MFSRKKESEAEERRHGRYYVEGVQGRWGSAEKEAQKIQERLDAGDEKGWSLLHMTSYANTSAGLGNIILVWDTNPEDSPQ